MFSKAALKKASLRLLFWALLFWFIAFLAAESYVRLFSGYEHITPEILKNRSLREIPVIGNILPAQIHDITNTLGAHLHINSKGYRGREFEFKKAPGTLRIVFYGGSAVFDIGNSDPEDWPHRVETSLRQKGFPQVEVINAGVPGYNTYGVLRNLLTEGFRLEPDYLVLYCAWNDIKYFHHEKPLLRTFSNEITPTPLYEYQNFIDRWLCEISQVYVRIRYRYFMWKEKIGTEGRKPRTKPTDRIDREMLNQYHLNLKTFVDVARNIGAVPVLMTEATLVTSHNTPEEKKKIQYDFQSLTPKSLERAYKLTDILVKKTAREKKVFMIDASHFLTGKSQFFYNNGHLSKEGSAALAAIVSEALVKLLHPQA